MTPQQAFQTIVDDIAQVKSIINSRRPNHVRLDTTLDADKNVQFFFYIPKVSAHALMRIEVLKQEIAQSMRILEVWASETDILRGPLKFSIHNMGSGNTRFVINGMQSKIKNGGAIVKDFGNTVKFLQGLPYHQEKIFLHEEVSIKAASAGDALTLVRAIQRPSRMKGPITEKIYQKIEHEALEQGFQTSLDTLTKTGKAKPKENLLTLS